MANALFNILEPSVVQLIHEMAVDPDEIEVKVLYYVRDWAETPEFFFLVLPRDATIHNLKTMLTYEELFHTWEVSRDADLWSSTLGSALSGGWRRRGSSSLEGRLRGILPEISLKNG